MPWSSETKKKLSKISTRHLKTSNTRRQSMISREDKLDRLTSSSNGQSTSIISKKNMKMLTVRNLEKIKRSTKETSNSANN